MPGKKRREGKEGCLHHRSANCQDSFPFSPVQRQDREEGLQEGDVEDGEVKEHGQGDGVDEHRVVAEEEGEKRFTGGERIHGVQHLNHDQNGKGDGRGGLGHIVAEHLAANLRELS